mmetsp:Transcript_9729/g.11073  ORF Transcript_9729/g.11073 Transcript_9729/m.11073 type:complete len:323 (-) Transcript_9729:317-1285(-)
MVVVHIRWLRSFFQTCPVSHCKTPTITFLPFRQRQHSNAGTLSALTSSSSSSSSSSGAEGKANKLLPNFVSSVIGRRPYMEDTYAVSTPPVEESVDAIFAVFDGHAGANCARYLADHLINEVRIQITCDPDNVEKALKNAFTKLDDEFCDAARRLHMEDGSTANMAVIRRDKESGTPTEMWIANTGDSRAVVVRSTGDVHQLSTDHKAIEEKERIERMGGYIVNVYGMYRVNGILAISRAFGDASLKPFVTAEPEVHHRKISKHDQYLCLATDGLWDEVTNDETGSILQNGGPELGAKVLSDMAYKRGSYDNISVLCISLQD